MLRKLWKILWISAVSFIGLGIVASVLVAVFVPAEELERASASIPQQKVEPPQPAKPEPPEPPLPPKDDQPKFIPLDRQFIGGKHWKSVEYVKNRMHNPKSFKHVRTTWTNRESQGFRIINMTYRGTNLYNAIVTNTIHVKVDLNGNVAGVIPNDR